MKWSLKKLFKKEVEEGLELNESFYVCCKRATHYLLLLQDIFKDPVAVQDVSNFEGSDLYKSLKTLMRQMVRIKNK